MIRGVLTIKERAYIIDKIGGTTFYEDEFGQIDPGTEKEIIASIFKKLELTYYIPNDWMRFRIWWEKLFYIEASSFPWKTKLEKFPKRKEAR